MQIRILLFSLMVVMACAEKKEVPVVAFLDFIEDPTIAQAKEGFFDALKDRGFSEADSNIAISYANAHGDIPTLGQACDLLISENPALLATNVTLSTITAVQRTKTLPLFMMVSPRPDIAGLSTSMTDVPANLFGVYETLEYIDTSVTMIKLLKPGTKVVGSIYNQAEPQSVDAYEKLEEGCRRLGMELVALPVNSSAETQLVMQSLLTNDIDVFFALPDNVIFASFETVIRSCDNRKIPVFTSEAGLVARGAVASFGADFYQWGYQSGLQAAQYLRQKSTAGLRPEIVNVRRRIYNPEYAKRYNIYPDSTFIPYKETD